MHSIYEPRHEKPNILLMRNQRRRSASQPLAIFYACAARFVSDLVGNYIVGVLMMRLIYMYNFAGVKRTMSDSHMYSDAPN